MVEKYKNYIEGKDWLQKSTKYLNKNPICEICHKWPSKQVHHNSYENIGEELEEDLTAMCDRCHFHIHLMPPMIEDPSSLKKAMKLLEDFRNYPKLKTLVLNEISDLYFDGRFMIDVAKEIVPNTAFLPQNLMEIFYSHGLSIGEDIIEKATQISFSLKMKAGKNAFLMKKDSDERKERFKNGELKYINLNLTTTKRPELSKEEIIKERKKRWILHLLRDKETLARAKSFANINYYGGGIFFNREGIYTPEQFFLKLRSDNLIDRLFEDMGGTLEDISKGVDK